MPPEFLVTKKAGLFSRMREGAFFAREYLRERTHTGSFWPTSRTAARELTSPVLGHAAPCHILELGGGTGAITTAILNTMRSGDTLGICEINERFMASLQRRLSTEALFLAHRDQVSFHRCPAQLLPATACYDVIVASLPFLNFDVDSVHAIFKRLEQVSHPGTVMTFYEYVGLRRLGTSMPIGPWRRRIRGVEAYLDAKGRQKHSIVWWNLLPLQVYTLVLSSRPILADGSSPSTTDAMRAA